MSGYLASIESFKGANKKRRRVGRGESSGWGKTAGRGHKGQKARSGVKMVPNFEGGQMPLVRRVPKSGFTNPFKKEFNLFNLKDLDRFAEGEVVDLASLKSRGMISKTRDGLKILGEGSLKHPLTIKAQGFSKSALKKIEEAGAVAEVVSGVK